MKCRIIRSGLILIVIFSLSVSISFAAEKNKALIMLDATRTAVETAAGKIEGNKEAAADLERARTALKSADASYKDGKSLFGFGDLTPEAEKEVRFSVDMADLATATALSRVEFVRATAELEAIEKQYASAKATLKLFEDRKAELERLRLESAACQKTGKELEAIKSEKVALISQVEQLSAESSRADKLKIEQLELARKLDEMKAENASLSVLLEKQLAEIKILQESSPQSEDAKKKATKK